MFETSGICFQVTNLHHAARRNGSILTSNQVNEEDAPYISHWNDITVQESEESRKTEIRTTHRKAWIPMHDHIHRSREFTADASDLPLHQWNAIAHFSARFYRASPWSSVTKVELENG